MSNDARWAGIDTSTRTYSVCVVDETGHTVSKADLPADAAAADAFLSSHLPGLTEVALETGRTSIHLARRLTELGYPVSVYDALKVHKFLRLKPNKTDVNDALGLAEIARIGGSTIRKVYLKPLHLSLLRTKLVTRERLIKMRKVNEGAIMSLLHSYGVRASGRVSSRVSLRRVVAEMLTKVERSYDVPVRGIVMPLVELSVSLRQEELRLENELKEWANADEACRRLMEIPGVGPITSISFMTAIGDPSRFEKTEDVGPYLGLTPKVWQTGAYTRSRRISKTGSGMTRKHLHAAARQTLDSRTNSPLQAWGRSLAVRANRRKALVALARKLAVIMLAIWKSGSRFDYTRAPPVAKTSGMLQATY